MTRGKQARCRSRPHRTRAPGSSPGQALGAGPPSPALRERATERREAGEGLHVDPSDIDRGDWVERRLPARARPYARLARLDRPIGTWLLLFPGWWGIALAARRWPDPALLALFALGAVVMRGAGCTLNDIADRHYDGAGCAHPAAAIAERCRDACAQAMAFLLLQLAIGAAVLFSLNRRQHSARRSLFSG